MQKKHYDFIEIGSSDFHTLIESCDDHQVGLCIEPLEYQLNNLPSKKNVTKVNAAITNKTGSVNLYYIDEDKIYEHNLPFWVRGCNSVNKPHEYTKQKIGSELYDEIVSIKKVPSLTWSNLIDEYQIGSVGLLKIDTEGFEHIILGSYFEICEENPNLYADEIIFEYNETSNKKELDLLITKLKNYSVEYLEEDVKLTKKITDSKKAYVYYSTENYLDIVESSIKCLKRVSDLPIYVYVLNSDKKINLSNVTCVKWSCDIRDSDSNMYFNDSGNFYINRSNKRIYDILIQRPLIVKHCLENFSDFVCYIDSDSVPTNLVDTIFDFFDVNSKFPYFTRGIYDYLFWNGRGGNVLSSTLEKPACDLFGIDQSVRNIYYQTGYFVSSKKNIEFLEEWYWLCCHPKIKNDVEYYASYNEETIVNVLLWKYNYQKGLPLIYINGGIDIIHETNKLVSENVYDTQIRDWYRIPEKKEHILFYHGEKDPNKMIQMSNILNPNSEEKKGVYYKNIKIADVGYVINLPERTDRKESVISLLNELKITGYEFIDGVKFEQEEFKKLGCTATYLEIFKRILSSNYDNVLVIEDDVKLMSNVTENDLDKIFGDWNNVTQDYDVVALGTKLLPRTKIIPNGETHGYFEEMLCTQSLFYKRDFISHYISLMENYLDNNHFLYKCTVDMFLNDCSCEQYRFIHSPLHKKYNFGITIPMIFTQTDSFSDNELSNQDYDKIMENSFWRSLSEGQKIKPLSKSTDKINLLYLAPHLSTGGMPGFLLKRIESIKEYYPNINIFVAEYSNFSPVYVVQKNRIRSLIPESNFFTLGENKYELIDIIKKHNIDIVHVEEIVEGFESFNQIPKELMSLLYDDNRTWRMVETCHNVWFDPNTNKKYSPDAYAFCTPYHKEKTFSQMDSYSELIEFPIENKFRTQNEKIESRIKLGLDLNKKHIINVGLWTSGKNQKEGVEIARLLESSNPEIQFHFIGNQAPNFQDYWEPIMENLPSNVKVWGERDDIDLFMKSADLFMFNSTWECNPLVLREAISYGLNVVCRNLPQYMDMFENYINPIDDNIQKTKELILKIIDTTPIFDISENQSELFAKKHFDFYSLLNTKSPKRKTKIRSKIQVVQYFIGQPYLEILGNSDDIYNILFLDENNKVQYQNNLPINHWVKLNRQYFTKWRTQIRTEGELIYDQVLDYTHKRVFIAFDSSSLGDSVAWIPYCLEFKKKHNCHVIVSTFWNKLFEKVYPELEFVKPGTNVQNIFGMYKLGWFYNEDLEPELCNTIPLQKAATNILGLDFTEIQPRIHFDVKKRPYEGKYVTIATNSTAGCKFWTREGWQSIINYLHDLGYKIINVSKEDNPFKNAQKIKDTSIENTMNVIHHSEFFIGLSSGLSWLAWGLGKHVVMISNFTEHDHEFTTNCTRITKTDVCHGCWNKSDIKFDKGDWNWCPYNKGTERQFECHTSITPLMVINSIQHLL